MSLPRVFVDTGAWFAVQIEDDEHHAQAAETFRRLLEGPCNLVTTNHVVGETYTLLRTVRGYPQAVRFLDLLEAATRVQRVFVSEDLEKRAIALLHRYHDHDFSFVDAASFAVMRAQRIRHAFAFDSHFATAGFLRIPLDLPLKQLQ
jgi:predicted nucleic acid-binding protein